MTGRSGPRRSGAGLIDDGDRGRRRGGLAHRLLSVPTGVDDDGAGRLLESLGHHVELAHPEAMDDSAVSGPFFEVFNAHTAATLDAIERDIGREIREGDVEPLTWASAQIARELTAARYIEGVNALHAWARWMASWWEGGFDLLVTPTIAEPPPPLGELAGTRSDWTALAEILVRSQTRTPQGVTRTFEVTHVYDDAEQAPITEMLRRMYASGGDPYI